MIPQVLVETLGLSERPGQTEEEHLVEAGEIDPDHIHTPGIYVKRIVHVTRPTKRIEQLTTRKRPAMAGAAAGGEV